MTTTAAVQAKDLIVLGSGPGGYVAAIRAAQLGRKVSIVERDALGGICLNWGCIPSKALLKSAQLYHDVQRAAEFGIESSAPTFDFTKIMRRSRDVAGKLSGGVSYLMKKNKIEVLEGHGTLESGRLLNVKNKAGETARYSFNDIIIATGARARPFPGVDVDGQVVHTYRTILENQRFPKKLLVVGSGAIGMEFAYFFHTLGAEVSVVEMLPQIVPMEDTELAQALEKHFVKKGMQIRTEAQVLNVKKNGQTISATIKTKDKEEQWSGDTALIAIGVLPNSENLGLEKVGVELNSRGFIKVDPFLRTSVPHFFAIGDVTGNQMLAHKASHEGLVAAEAACGHTEHAMRYDNIPSCTYCQPQIASIGLTERAVKEKGIKYKVGKMPFSAIGKAIAIGEPEGVFKVIIDAELGEVLGVHIMHSEATELIAEAAAIRSHEGIAASVMDTIHPHPTLSEAMGEAMAIALGRPVNF